MQLKSSLVAAPVLTFPNVTKPFVLDTDAIGLGAVLSQIDNSDREHPVALASRSLSWTERRYSVFFFFFFFCQYIFYKDGQIANRS